MRSATDYRRRSTWVVGLDYAEHNLSADDRGDQGTCCAIVLARNSHLPPSRDACARILGPAQAQEPGVAYHRPSTIPAHYSQWARSRWPPRPCPKDVRQSLLALSRTLDPPSGSMVLKLWCSFRETVDNSPRRPLLSPPCSPLATPTNYPHYCLYQRRLHCSPPWLPLMLARALLPQSSP